MLEHLVVDSGAIIKGCGYEFHKTSKRFWTVQDVVNEIRDSKSLHLLETLPFELEIRIPSETALRAVADFARKTGDFASLSLTDMRLLALTYQLEVEENGLKYIRAEPALTLRLAKAAIDAAKALKKSSVAVVGSEGQIKTTVGDAGIFAFTPVASTSAGKASEMGAVAAGGVGGGEKAQGIDWGSVIAEAGKDVTEITETTLVEGEVRLEGNTVDNKEVEAEEEVEEEDEEEDNIDSTEFDELIEVEDVFGKEIAERESDSRVINSIEEGEEGEEKDDDDDESEDEETDDSEDEEESDDDDDVTKTPGVPVVPVPVQTGDINFSEDFFPVLSAEGPKRSKKVWPVPTNENIDRTPVINNVCTSSDGTGVSGDGLSGVESPKSAVWGTGTGTGAGVKNWSQVAALSVKAAVETATDNSHTMANSAFNSTRDWSRKPKNYKKNNASMPVKVEVSEEDSANRAMDSISVLPLKATVPFFPSMKTPIVNPSMPSRIMGSGGGGQSELATKKAALEDDGAGWINPSNIQKYRAGAHISMVQFDKPTGRGNSGVHLDYKESPLLAANMLRSNGSFSRSNTDSAANSVCGAATGTGTGTPSDTKSMTSRQSNYKNVPTDPLRSMASMMMMGKNTITTSIPLENWKDLKFSKTSSQTFFSTAGKTVNSDDFKTDSKVLTEIDDSVTNAINSTQHLTISNNNKRSKSNKNEVYSMKSACVTTDFSMQNVLMQMGLNVISVDGMLIRAAKQWVLRCMACFKVHYEMDRLFCSKCGANHMSRVGASVNAKTGELKLHLKANYVVNTLGTKYSIAKPGNRGRYEGELLLREDQLLSGIWRQKNVKIKKNVISFFGADVTSDVGIHVNKGQAIVVGMGKKNPNAQKGRERRGKSKKQA